MTSFIESVVISMVIGRQDKYCTDYGCPAPEWRFDGAGIWTIFYNKTNPNTEEKSSEKIIAENIAHIIDKATAQRDLEQYGQQPLCFKRLVNNDLYSK